MELPVTIISPVEYVGILDRLCKKTGTLTYYTTKSIGIGIAILIPLLLIALQVQQEHVTRGHRCDHAIVTSKTILCTMSSSVRSHDDYCYLKTDVLMHRDLPNQVSNTHSLDTTNLWPCIRAAVFHDERRWAKSDVAHLFTGDISWCMGLDTYKIVLYRVPRLISFLEPMRYT